MKNLWKPLVIVLTAAIMIGDVLLDRRRAAGEIPVAVEQEVIDLPLGTSAGELAPDFAGRTLGGGEIRLSELRGKTVLVNVFASWCGPCRAEAPHLVEVDEKFGDDVVFLGLNLQETPDAVADFQADFGIEFPLVLNEDGRLTELYRPIGLPTSWFIGPDGVVEYVHSGPMTADLLERAIEDVRSGRSPDPFAGSGS